MSDQNIKLAAFFVVGLILSAGLLALTSGDVTPVLTECHVNTEC